MLLFWVGLKRSILFQMWKGIAQWRWTFVPEQFSDELSSEFIWPSMFSRNLNSVCVKAMQVLWESNFLSDSKANLFCSRTQCLSKPSTHTGGAMQLHFRLVPLKPKFSKKSPIASKPLEKNCRCTIQ